MKTLPCSEAEPIPQHRALQRATRLRATTDTDTAVFYTACYQLGIVSFF